MTSKLYYFVQILTKKDMKLLMLEKDLGDLRC
jgi:hypothetical protein